MTTYIVFLRGINVGGHKKFPKANQFEILSNLNFQNPQVYLQTGNWLFQAEESKEVLEKKLLKAIEERQGWQVPILLKTTDEIVEILNDCPFSEEEKRQSYFMLLFETPSEEKIKAIEAISFEGEKFAITQDCIYLFSSVGYGNSKLNSNFFESKLKVHATTRNFNTMFKLIDLAKFN
ncbi:MAG: DUF1697 domain-containing protein [Flavobacteriaceae bacterium]|nr:DUF1697 domain-containing protein [Flavobacteriaceae bacterium]